MFAVRQGHADFGDGGEVARAGVADPARGDRRQRRTAGRVPGRCGAFRPELPRRSSSASPLCHWGTIAPPLAPKPGMRRTFMVSLSESPSHYEAPGVPSEPGGGAAPGPLEAGEPEHCNRPTAGLLLPERKKVLRILRCAEDAGIANSGISPAVTCSGDPGGTGGRP